MDQIKRPTPATTAAAPHGKKKTHLPFAISSLIIAVLALGVSAYLHFGKPTADLAGIDNDRYQALFLSNGQTYFGKLSLADRDTVKITDIYYLEVNQAVQPGEASDDQTPAETQLVKLGNELHAPDDTMFINREHILFWENLKNDGKVVSAIKESK